MLHFIIEMFISCCTFIAVSLVGYYLYRDWKSEQQEKFYAQWKDVPKNTVVVHCFPRLVNIVNASPFVLKVETFLRMAKIKYQVDEANAFGTKGKTPWISINGEHITDSQLIVEFLRKKFSTSLNRHHTDEQLAIARSVRIMLEERWFWCMPFWRFIWNFGRSQPFKGLHLPIHFRLIMRYTLMKQAWGHGIGRHAPEEVIRMFQDDLRTVSKILGTKAFILGGQPCEDDAAIFGQIAQAVWGMPGSPYEKLVDDELLNLKAYCIRMKEKFWPDWDQCLRKEIPDY